MQKFRRLTMIPEKFEKMIAEKKIVIDCYSRIQSLESKPHRRDGNKNETVFSEGHLAFLDYEDLFFRLEKFKRERTWHNLNISKSKIRKLLQDKTWYRMFVPAQSMEKNDFANVSLWQEMASKLMQKYCDELYNYCKAAFMKPRLELRLLTSEDDNIPSGQEYQLIVDSSEEALINDIRSLQKHIANAKQDIFQSRDLKAWLSDTHLYQPVMHVAKNSKIQIAPVSLNESEFQFVEDLRDYLQKQGEAEFYLLRNESRGKGIGFFEAGNFYPDFLLWKVKDGIQSIAFIEPHGLFHTGPGDKKIEFHKTIKDIEARLSSEKVCLNSFIVTPTKFAELNWDMDIEALAQMNVHFMHDRRDTYISSIISRMEE